MQYILLSAGNDPPPVSIVSDIIAHHLAIHCQNFDHWLHHSTQAAAYRQGDVVYDTEKDFIIYLNHWVSPSQPAIFLETLHGISSKEALPESYQNCPWHHF